MMTPEMLANVSPWLYSRMTGERVRLATSEELHAFADSARFSKPDDCKAVTLWFDGVECFLGA